MPAEREKCPYLFVYGTLRRAAHTEWSRVLCTVSDCIGGARTRGALFQLGKYPGFVPSGADEWVTGEVCRLHDPSTLLPKLDAYEGCGPDDPPPHEYRRELIEVVIESGETIRAWAYIYCLSTADRPRIASGDYLNAR